MTSKLTSIPGATLHRIGPPPRMAMDVMGTGPLVLFLHGIGGNRLNWLDQVPVFAVGGFTAAAWDARGYADSDDYEGPLDFADFGRDLLRAVDHFGVARAHLVGLSMGGRIAQQFCLTYPERVATLTLVDTHDGFGNLTAAQRADYIRVRREPLLAGKTPADLAPELIARLAGPATTPAMKRRLLESMAALRTGSYLKSLEATVNQASVGDISRISVPTHLIVGEHDKLTTPALMAEMQRRIAGSVLTVVPRAGHLSNIDNVPAFNAAALEFIGRYRDR